MLFFLVKLNLFWPRTLLYQFTLKKVLRYPLDVLTEQIRVCLLGKTKFNEHLRRVELDNGNCRVELEEDDSSHTDKRDSETARQLV